MMFMGMGPFGALAAGAIAVRLGAPLAVMMGAVVGLGGAVMFGLRLPAMRGEARRLIIAQQMVGGEPVQEMSAQADDDQD